MFRYKAVFFNESNGAIEAESGIVCAADYGVAATKIASCYGEKLICMELGLLEDVLCIDEILSIFKESSK